MLLIGPNFVFADGTIKGKLLGSVRYTPGGYNFQTDDDNVFLPLSTSFEGGAVNQTTYECTYVGSISNITSANCKIVKAAMKGELVISGATSKLVDEGGATVATLPDTKTSYDPAKTNGGYYICEYSGPISSPTSIECELNQAASPDTSNGGVNANEEPVTRLFNISGCPTGQELICWTSKVYGWSQSALLVAAVGAFVIAGIMYMTSGGNPQMIGKSKKIIIGALSGIAVIVLGKFFLTKVIGVPWL